MTDTPTLPPRMQVVADIIAAARVRRLTKLNVVDNTGSGIDNTVSGTNNIAAEIENTAADENITEAGTATTNTVVSATTDD